MKVVLLGSEGMLGVDMHEALMRRGHTVFACTRETLDITRADQVATLATYGADMVVNCAAYTNVEGAEDNRAECYAINTTAVQAVADVCKASGMTLVQVSTDYVFDGIESEYEETATAHPLNVYGASKAEAEQAARDTLEKYYIVRTAWLYGAHGKNFVETVRRVCGDKGEMRIVQDQVGCPTYTRDLAEAIIDLFDKPYGTYHRTNDGACSWYDFACEIVAQSRSACNIQPCTSDEFPQKARRPRSSILCTTQLPPLRTWQAALQEYLTRT